MLREVRGCKTELEQRLGVAVRYFAYPHGKRGVHYDDSIKQIVAREYELACATTRGRNGFRSADLLEIHRICVQSWWSPRHFAREMNGTFEFAGSAQRCVRGAG